MGAQHDAIMASQLQTRLAMAAADFCQWEWNIQSGLKFHSTAWTQRIGLEHDRFQPLQDWIDTVHPDDNNAFASAISEGAKNKVPGSNVRFGSGQQGYRARPGDDHLTELTPLVSAQATGWYL